MLIKEVDLENAQFKSIYAESELKVSIAKAPLAKKTLKPSQRREIF